MTYWLFILLLALGMPWNIDGLRALSGMDVVIHRYDGYGPIDSRPYSAAITDDGTVYLIPLDRQDLAMNLLHESQHFLAGRKYGLANADWDEFGRLAMNALQAGDYNRQQVITAKYYLVCGGYELHAQLPWIVHGDIPSTLQPWYPWFNIHKVEEKQWRILFNSQMIPRP